MFVDRPATAILVAHLRFRVFLKSTAVMQSTCVCERIGCIGWTLSDVLGFHDPSLFGTFVFCPRVFWPLSHLSERTCLASKRTFQAELFALHQQSRTRYQIDAKGDRFLVGNLPRAPRIWLKPSQLCGYACFLKPIFVPILIVLCVTGVREDHFSRFHYCQ